MKKTLVLAVDRDDDFGVKGRVVTPVIGIQNCLSAANALGIADPEDSDINALYAAISTCLDLQDDGVDAEVALICGNEKVGHRSDLAVVSELEKVLDEIKPDNVVLIGDGAEDEYIYPIISSRSHVDSVRKVYVKQAPNIESSFYIITKMLSEPNKRKRFIAPIGLIVFIIALFLLLPDIIIMLTEDNIGKLTDVSRDMILLLIGLVILMYGYSVSNRWSSFTAFFKDRVLSRGTMVAMTSLAIGIVLISAIVCYYEIMDMYVQNSFQSVILFLSMMIWPVAIALMVFIFGSVLEEIQDESVFRISNVFDCMSLASIAMVLMGLFDILLSYVYIESDIMMGIGEVVFGIIITLIAAFVKNYYRPDAVEE